MSSTPTSRRRSWLRWRVQRSARPSGQRMIAPHRRSSATSTLSESARCRQTSSSPSSSDSTRLSWECCLLSDLCILIAMTIQRHHFLLFWWTANCFISVKFVKSFTALQTHDSLKVMECNMLCNSPAHDHCYRSIIKFVSSSTVSLISVCYSFSFKQLKKFC